MLKPKPAVLPKQNAFFAYAFGDTPFKISASIL
jgi:hypothetical protein